MPTVRLDSGALLRGDERVLPLMGEMHYWRLSPHRWPDALKSVRRLGIQTIATYVPWQYHELSPGEFDFEGRTEPQRNLIGFLDLLAKERFSCFIRPGPYIYAEWTNAGVPDRVIGMHRLSEAYRREAIVWMRAAAAAIRPFLATSTLRSATGGPIALFQPDNEADLFSHWFEGATGLDGGGGSGASGKDPAVSKPFVEFLRTTYSNIAALNTAWGTSYDRFDDAQPAASTIDRFGERGRASLARARDYWRFQHWATAQIIDWHAREYRALGIDVPMVANYYPGGDVQNWRVLSKTSVEFLGIDWYPRNEFRGPPAPPGAAGATGGGGIFGLPPRREHRVFLDSCRLQRAVSPLPFIAEFECGVWHGYESYTGAFTPNHYRLLVCSALLAGIKGFNWYMLVARDNWYFSPINERGDLRGDLAEAFLDLHRVYRELDPPSLEKSPGVAAFFECEQIGTDDLLGNNPLLQSLYDAGIDCEILDAEALDAAAHPPPLLLYAAADWLDGRKQESLGRYVERGGTLVLFRNYPRADDQFRPTDTLGVTPPSRILSHLGKKVEVDPGAGPGLAEGPVWVWDSVPDGAAPITATQVAGRQQAIENADAWMRGYIGRQWTVGYHQLRGSAGGRILVLGLSPSASLVRAVCASAGVRSPVSADSPGVQAAIFDRRDRRNDPRRFLIAANLDPHPILAGFDLAGRCGDAARVRARDLFSGEERVGDAGRLALPIGRASGSAWELVPV